MNKILPIIYFFSTIPLVYLQDLTSSNPVPIVIYSNVASTNIGFSLSNSANQFPYTLHCDFVNSNSAGYAQATFTDATNTGTGGTITFSNPLSNFQVGRVRPFICVLNNLARTNVTQYLSVRPVISAMVCSAVSVVNTGAANIPVDIPVKFTDALTSSATVTCTSPLGITVDPTRNSVAAGTMATTVTVRYNSAITATTDTVSCTFAMTTTTLPPIAVSANIAFQSGSIAFYPSTISTSLPVMQFSLVPNYAPPSDLTLPCSIIITPSNAVTCPTSPTVPLNWTVSPSQLVLPAGQAQPVPVTVTRSAIPSSTPASYTLVCCTTSQQMYSASITVSNTTLQIPQVLASGVETQSVSDVRFSQLSTCPCDLTVATCDPNCCCDSFCNCAGGVVPIPGPYGGFFNDTLPRSCQYRDALTNPVFHSVLCVQNESPNILGDYFPMQPIINNLATFVNVLSSSTRSSGFQISTSDVSSTPLIGSNLIPIIWNSISPSVGASRFLYLPKRGPSGSDCVLTNPIVMLQPYNSDCSYTVTNTNCATLTDPRLSSQFYLVSSTVTATNCAFSLAISAIESNIPVFSFYSDASTGSLLSQDNGYTAPPVPQLDNTICRNVVQSVAYTIYYNSTGVALVSASIVLANVPINSNLNQKFNVSFVNSNVSPSVAASASFPALQSASSAPVSTISGLYGYDEGKPILTVSNRASRQFNTIKTLPTTISGLCSDPLSNNVLFLQTTLSQCKFSIPQSASCADKRIALSRYLNQVLNNSFVAVYGNPSSDADFVTVTESTSDSGSTPTPSGILDQQSTTVPLNSLSSYCPSVSTGIVITIFYSRQGKDRNEYIHNIVGVTKRYINSNLGNLSPYGVSSNNDNFITLTSYVEFNRVSSGTTGASSTDDIIPRVCFYDICIDEIFYPWMFNYEGKQGFYEEAFGIFLLGLAIFLLVTTYPWW